MKCFKDYKKLKCYRLKTVEYNGKTLSRYDAEQQQRYNERNIRRWKKESAMLNEADIDNSFAKKKVSEWNAKAQDFTNKTGIPRQEAREKVFTSGGKSDIIEILKSKGITFKERISVNEIIVEMQSPKIVETTKHFNDNLINKIDRNNLTIEASQEIVDNARLKIYQENKRNIKFLADNGYVILNLQNKLVTAVPQKWRKKYDKYLKE